MQVWFPFFWKKEEENAKGENVNCFVWKRRLATRKEESFWRLLMADG
jgi:hypothetical protein